MDLATKPPCSLEMLVALATKPPCSLEVLVALDTKPPCSLEMLTTLMALASTHHWQSQPIFCRPRSYTSDQWLWLSCYLCFG